MKQIPIRSDIKMYKNVNLILKKGIGKEVRRKGCLDGDIVEEGTEEEGGPAGVAPRLDQRLCYQLEEINMYWI